MSSKALTKQPSLLPRDPVLDFIKKVYGKAEKAVDIIEENLQRMIGNFTTCQGEFFLIIERHLDSCFRGGPGCFPQPDLEVTTTDLWMGIIDGEFRFGKELTPFHFPIRMPYASGNFYHDPMLREGSLFLPEHNYVYEILQHFQKERSDIIRGDLDKPGLNIAVGDEEVKNLIRKYQWRTHERHGDYPLMVPVYKMCDLLGRYLTNFPEQVAMIQKSPELFGGTKKKLKK